MCNNSIENIFLENEIEYSYILPVINKICDAAGLKVTNSNSLSYKANNLFVGTSNSDEIENIANEAINQNVENAIIISGSNFPFITPFGTSYIAEAWKGKIFKYCLGALDFGLKEVDESLIKVKDELEAKKVIDEILSGKLKDIKYEISIINASMPLYISKKADSIQDGIDLAKKIIQSDDLK